MSAQFSDIATEPGPASGLLTGHHEEFARCFGRAAFTVGHRLAESGLFTLPKLARAAELLMNSGRGFRLHMRDAQGKLDARFADMKGRELFTSAFEGLEHSNSWIKLNNIGDIDADYRALADDAVRDMEALSGQELRSKITLQQLTLFISSPHSVTPYHMDHECNILCQIAGEKDVCVFDPSDRELVSYGEIERFYAGDLNSTPYRKELQPRGRVFRLTPGVGVHHPPLAPHWVKNLSSVSVSVSINLCMTPIDDRAHVFQVNHLLRKIGVHPSPPGVSPRVDRLKAGCLRALASRHPKTAAEVVNSGLLRLRAPLYLARDVAARLRHAPAVERATG